MDRPLSECPAACEAGGDTTDQVTLSSRVLGPTLGITSRDRTWKRFFSVMDCWLLCHAFSWPHGNQGCICTTSSTILSGTDFSGMLFKNQGPIKSLCFSCLLWRVLCLGFKPLKCFLHHWPVPRPPARVSGALMIPACWPHMSTGAKRGWGPAGSAPGSTRHTFLPRDLQGHSGDPPTSWACATS